MMSEADDRPRRPAPLDQPLKKGLVGFLFRPGALKSWTLVCLALMMLALIANGFHALIAILPEDITNGFAMLIYRGSWHIFTGLTLFAILFSFYPAACFLAVVQDTAAGGDDVHWPADLWFEYAFKLVFVVWLVVASLTLAALLLVLLVPFVPPSAWWLGVLGLGAMLFPIVTLSVLAGGAPYFVVHHAVLVNLLRRPLIAAALYAYTFALLVPVLALAVWMVADLVWWLAPWLGLLAGTAFLVYARVLGRVGWLLEAGPRKKRKKRKKKRVADDEAER